MTEKLLVLEKIRKKEAEIQYLEEKLKAAKTYIQALKDVLALFGHEDSEVSGGESSLRPGGSTALAREAILRAGKPLNVDELLDSIGKEATKATRATMRSALSSYVRRGEIFTRPAPNTFGLIELGHTPDRGFLEPPSNFGKAMDATIEPDEI